MGVGGREAGDDGKEKGKSQVVEGPRAGAVAGASDWDGGGGGGSGYRGQEETTET